MNLPLRNLRRPIVAATAVAALGIGVPAALALSDPPARPRLAPVTAASAVDDVSGPCDEAGHADDPRCTGAPAATTGTTPTTLGDDAADDDLSGPCDEAEHADDPRCTGAAGTTDDRSGPSDDEDDDDDRSGHGAEDDVDEDRSGSNSGRG